MKRSKLFRYARNVRNGLTAFGKPSTLGKPRFVCTMLRFSMVLECAMWVCGKCPYQTQDDTFLTAVLWKLLQFASARDFEDDFESYEYERMMTACERMVENPLRFVHGKISLAGILRMNDMERARASNIRAREKADALEARYRLFCESKYRAYCETEPAPARSVIWTNGRYELQQLNHPTHLLDEGRDSDTCLMMVCPARRGGIEPKPYPHPLHWKEMASGVVEFYSVRTEGIWLATLAVKDDLVMELVEREDDFDAIDGLLTAVEGMNRPGVLESLRHVLGVDDEPLNEAGDS